MARIFIDDTTLRDGEQTPGLLMTKKEKIRIAKLLDQLGVDEIEAGFPASGKQALETFSAIKSLGLRAKILAWNRATIDDVKKSISAGADRVEISLPVSDIQIGKKLNKNRSWVLEQLKRVLDFCKTNNLYISVGGEDSSRADMSFLLQFVNTAEKYGADRFRFCDTVGILDPFKTYEIVKEIKSSTALPIEIHFHNDLGMAVANSIAAVKAGATYINTTVLGLGERAGNASLEELTVALKVLGDHEVSLNFKNLTDITTEISKILKVHIPFNKPIIGRNAFRHESGMHVDGVLKSPENYEPYNPEMIGKTRDFSLGITSGRSSVIYLLNKLGFDLNKDHISESILDITRYIFSLKKRLRFF